MLHSMIKNPRPTRAEVTDIATAIFDWTDAIMLSGETAYWNYPVESVETMTRIALQVEKDIEGFVDSKYTILSSKISAHLAKVAVKLALRMEAKAIIADTTTGRTVRNVTGFRGRTKILAMVYAKNTMREMALSYGVYAFYMEPLKNTDAFLNYAATVMVDQKLLHEDDTVIFLAGSFGKSKGANFVQVLQLQDVLNNCK